MKLKHYAIILAAGVGRRTGYSIQKQFIKVAGKMLIEHTIEIFENHPQIDEIFVVINQEHRTTIRDAILVNKYKKVRRILNGGNSRRESSNIGISAVPEDDAIVLVHDAVRPFVSDRIITSCLEALKKHDAVDVAISSSDTIIKVNDVHMIEQIPDRTYMLRGQTPQGFRAGVIKEAHRLAAQEDGLTVTDDCSLVLRYNLSSVYVIDGDEENIKVTYPLDIYIADRLFQLRACNVPREVSLENLSGKVIVVFGGTEGIGKAIVELAQNYNGIVYAFSRRSGVDVSVVNNVTSSLGGVYRREGKINFIINTAAIIEMGTIENRTLDSIYNEISINYIGSINVIKAAIPYLRKSHGSILLFTSSSYTRGRCLYGIYSSMKAALVNLMQALTDELRTDGIRINIVNPERTATPMRRTTFGEEPSDSLLKPEKVAEASLKTLLSDLTGGIVDVRKE